MAYKQGDKLERMSIQDEIARARKAGRITPFDRTDRHNPIRDGPADDLKDTL
jgi:hypothetical protein